MSTKNESLPELPAKWLARLPVGAKDDDYSQGYEDALRHAASDLQTALTEAKKQGPGEAVATFYAAREGSFIDLNNIDWGRWQLTSKEYHDQCVADPVRMPSNGQAGRICEAVALYTAPQVEAKK